jgi:hypothetical protein
MRPITVEDCKTMGLEGAKAEMANRVYEAALLFETLECAKRVRGSGHHLAQDVAGYAVTILEERWVAEAKPGDKGVEK